MDDDIDSAMDGSPLEGEDARLYRLESHQSLSSVFEDVEMAHDEVWLL